MTNDIFELFVVQDTQHPGHSGPFYVVESVNSVQNIILKDWVEIGVDSVNIMESVFCVAGANTFFSQDSGWVKCMFPGWRHKSNASKESPPAKYSIAKPTLL